MREHEAVRYLSRADVEAVELPMERVVALVEDALVEQARGRVQMPAKQWMELEGRWFDAMTALIPSCGYAATKAQSGSAANAGRGLPYLTGLLLLTDLQTGLIVSAMDVTWICQHRTAAASAVTVRHLANPGATAYAMMGTGAQGFSHFQAFRHVMPDLAAHQEAA